MSVMCLLSQCIGCVPKHVVRGLKCSEAREHVGTQLRLSFPSALVALE